MSTALVQRTVSFYGDDLIVIRQGETAYTPVKPICDALGLKWESQRVRIQHDEVLSQAAQMLICTPHMRGADDQARAMLCLPVDYLYGWLFGVQVKSIRPDLRERMILYKRECYRVLAQAFAPKPQPKLLPVERIVDSIPAMAEIIREHFDLDKPAWVRPPGRSYTIVHRDIMEVLDRAGVLVGRTKDRAERADARRRYYDMLIHEAMMHLGVRYEYVHNTRIYGGIWPKGWE